MRAELVEHSMFMNTPLYSVGGDVVAGLQRPPVVKDPTDIVYTVTTQGAYRFDLISKLFYDTPDLWWILSQVNNIIDPLVGISAGTVVRVPTRERLSKEGVLNG
jgi:hypothetical protein